jgi:hypothetical protein
MIMQENARERPLVRGRIEALLKKTTENGCTPGEARSALAKARELADRYGFAPDDFRWPVATSDDSEAAGRSPRPSRSRPGEPGAAVSALLPVS